MRKSKKYKIYCDLRNQIQELSINIPEDAKYIAIESSIVPRGKFIFFYNKRKRYLERKIINSEKYAKLEEIFGKIE